MKEQEEEISENFARNQVSDFRPSVQLLEIPFCLQPYLDCHAYDHVHTRIVLYVCQVEGPDRTFHYFGA